MLGTSGPFPFTASSLQGVQVFKRRYSPDLVMGPVHASTWRRRLGLLGSDLVRYLSFPVMRPLDISDVYSAP